jgi:hypothetical protein
MKVYIQRERTSVDAVGEYNPETRELIVLKGTRVSADVAQSATFRSARTIIKMRNEYVKDGIVMRDVPFKSPSSAGNFVTGRSTNGYVTWKDENGRTLHDIHGKERE